MDDFIVFKNFTLKYDAQAEPTLKNINLTIKKGQKVLLVGPSGSGKSTLGQCLNGIIPNVFSATYSGQFTIDGQDSFATSVYDKSHLVSTVLQDPDGQFIGLTVAEDLAFALENDCQPQASMKEAVDKWADILDLRPLLKQRPQDLSGGQKQRVSLGGVLIDESPILLFDEPLANLDPMSGQATIELIDEIHQSQQTTTIIIEHRLEDVLQKPVDLIVLLNEGEIVFAGLPDDLLHSDLLTANGIREPLYITLLRHFRLLDSCCNLSDLATLVTANPRLPELFIEQLNILYPDLLGFKGWPKLNPNHGIVATKITKQLADTAIELQSINFAYQKECNILQNLDLKIVSGQKIAIVGKNGAGKSTLAKILCNFVNPQGRVLFAGEDVSLDSIKERAEKIGYVLQNPNQMLSQNMIFDEVALGLRLRGLSEDEVKERVWQTLKVCGLYEYRNWPIAALSFGQKKRVTIAAILVLQPDIILLDEPTAGQDKRNYTEIMEFLNYLNELGHTIIMITHDMQLMLEYADRTLVVDQGHISTDLSPVELFARPEILQKSGLKQTSIYDLAMQLGIDPIPLTKVYLNIIATEIQKKVGTVYE